MTPAEGFVWGASFGLALEFALFPAVLALKITKGLCGDDYDDAPAGCVAFVFLLLIAAPFIGYWFYQTFEVVLR